MGWPCCCWGGEDSAADVAVLSPDRDPKERLLARQLLDLRESEG